MALARALSVDVFALLCEAALLLLPVPLARVGMAGIHEAKWSVSELSRIVCNEVDL